jgi:hypothetical protein
MLVVYDSFPTSKKTYAGRRALASLQTVGLVNPLGHFLLVEPTSS